MMKPLRTTIIMLPVLLPAALPARAFRSRVVVIPPWTKDGFSTRRESSVAAPMRRTGSL